VSERGGPASGLAGGLLAAALAVVLAVLGLWWAGQRLERQTAAREALPITAGRIPVAGIASQVEVLRDARGIPHIEARTAPDAWFGLGFAHAQDRLAQMLWLRRLARGTTAEVVGESGIASDRLARTLGIGFHADALFESLDAPQRAVLEAYARGVNARLARIAAGEVAPPVTTVSWGVAPEAWQPADGLALLKLVSWAGGARLETGIVLSDLIEYVGGFGARPLFPSSEGVQGIGVAFDLPSSPDARGRSGAARERAEKGTSPDPIDSLRMRGVAWAIGGGLSGSGAPLLAVDYQLAPTVPSLLYVVGLRAGSLDAAGATIPGIPAIWAGRNRDVAWALLPAQVHLGHLYSESLKPDPSGDGYLVRERRGWVPAQRREEPIRVRGPAGEMREEAWVVDTTANGPLVGGLLAGDGEPLSLAWPGARGGSGLEAMLGLLGASSADEIVATLRNHYEPVSTLVYADRHGSVGLQMAGWVPRLALPTGHVPVSARLGIFRWDEPVAFDQLPAQRLDPSGTGEKGATGWVIATDGPVGDGLRDRSIEWLWWDTAQGGRIAEVLEQASEPGPVDLRAMASVQAGLTARVDPAVLSALLALAGEPSGLSAEAVEVALLLREWNGEMDPQSQGAAVYHVLMLHLRKDLLEEPLGPELAARYLALPQARPRAIVEAALLEAARSGKSGGWSDRERLQAAVKQALHRTRVSLSYRLGPDRERWRWGRLHELDFRSFSGSQLGAFERGARLGPFGGEGGGALPRGVIGCADYAPAHPFVARSAATYRMTVDLASPDRMLSILAPGQSEHPGDRHFSDAVGAWLAGEPSLLLTSRFLVEETSDRKLILDPAP